MTPPLTQLQGEVEKAVVRVRDAFGQEPEYRERELMKDAALVALNAYRNSAEIRGMMTLLEEATRLDGNHCYCLELSEDELGGPKCLHCRIVAHLAAFKDSTPDKEKEKET